MSAIAYFSVNYRSYIHLLCPNSREERRWIEKQNKAARLKLKKEETSRIRQLVGQYQQSCR